MCYIAFRIGLEVEISYAFHRYSPSAATRAVAAAGCSGHGVTKQRRKSGKYRTGNSVPALAMGCGSLGGSLVAVSVLRVWVHSSSTPHENNVASSSRSDVGVCNRQGNSCCKSSGEYKVLLWGGPRGPEGSVSANVRETTETRARLARAADAVRGTGQAVGWPRREEEANSTRQEQHENHRSICQELLAGGSPYWLCWLARKNRTLYCL